MRVVSGRLKGFNVDVPGGIRPTTSRVRKSIFSLLKEEVKGKRVLDIFSGSGILGVEALSLGSKSCDFVDLKKSCCMFIKKSLSSLGLRDKGNVFCKDAFSFIKRACIKGFRYDIIFADPPYFKDYALKTLKSLQDCDILSPQGFLVLQVFLKDRIVLESANLELVLKKRYGQDLLLFFKHV